MSAVDGRGARTYGFEVSLAEQTDVHRVSTMQVRALLEGLQHVGVSTAVFLSKVGLDQGSLADPFGWFSLHHFDQLLTAAVALSGDEAFGLHWGMGAPMVQFDQLPILIATAPSLRFMVDNLLRFQPVLASRDELHLGEHGDRALLTCDVLALSERGRRVRTEALVTALLRMLRYFGEGSALRRVDIGYARPEYAAEYERLLGAPVYFAQPVTSLELSRAALDRTHQNRDDELRAQLLHRIESLRRRALGELSYADQVADLLRANLSKALSQVDVARACGISERSLRRSLAHEGVSFRELVERVRHERAKQLLALGEHSNKQMAGALGFAGVSGFQREIQRWTGESAAPQRAPRARRT